jgi:DNA-binding transcriptional regulator YiaG
MAKRAKRNLRTTEQRIAALEARIAALRALAKGQEKFSRQLVRQDRHRLQLSAAEYAELVGVAMITIYSWESGRSRPRQKELDLWLAVKGMPQAQAWKRLGIEEVAEFSGKAVRAERKRLGLSAKRYAKLVGVSVLTIYNWEQDRAVPREPTLEKWLKVRGIARAAARARLGLPPEKRAP